MSLTTPTVHIPETTVSVPSWTRRHLRSMAVAAGAVGASVLLALAVAGGGSDTEVPSHTGLTEKGSITAVDNRSAPAAPGGLAENGSITANDHRGAPVAGHSRRL